MSVKSWFAALFLVGLGAAPASAASITIDEVLYTSGVNAASLSGSALENLLTGLGFQLPTGLTMDLDDSLGSGTETLSDLLETSLVGGDIPPSLLESLRKIRIGVPGRRPVLTAVPEPGSLALLGIGLTAVAAFMRRAKRREGRRAA